MTANMTQPQIQSNPEPTAEAPATVMLALSTFRRSREAARRAFGQIRPGGLLIIAYIADVNLARYMVGTDIGLFPNLEKTCEREMLENHKKAGHRRVDALEQEARECGLSVRTYVEIGRFAHVALRLAKEENPDLIVTTRTNRPRWVTRFFGSPVDKLVEQAPCPVVVV